MATQTSNQYRLHAKNWAMLVIFVGLFEGLLVFALATALGIVGGLIGFVISLGVSFYLIVKLFEHIDTLILKRIQEFS